MTREQLLEGYEIRKKLVDETYEKRADELRRILSRMADLITDENVKLYGFEAVTRETLCDARELSECYDSFKQVFTMKGEVDNAYSALKNMAL